MNYDSDYGDVEGILGDYSTDTTYGNYGDLDSSYTIPSYDNQSASSALALFAGVGIVGMLISTVATVLVLISWWKIFVKYGKKGWESLIVGYNTVIKLEMTEQPIWYYFLFLIPIVNIFLLFKLNILIAKSFGKGVGFGVGLVLLPIVFLPILAFSKAEFVGVNGGGGSTPEQTPDMTNQPMAAQPVTDVSQVEVQPVAQPTTDTVAPQMETPVDQQVTDQQNGPIM